jgi:hypothetical protein
MFYAPFVEKSHGFMEFSAVHHAKAEVIQPDPIGAKTIVGESLTRVPAGFVRRTSCSWLFARRTLNANMLSSITLIRALQPSVHWEHPVPG